MSPRLAARGQSIAPFQVMAILGRARQLEARGRDIVHMEIGEPDFATPEPIVAAGQRALAEGHTHYTPSAGLPALREAIARYYADDFGLAIDPGRILVTPGASGALQITLAALLDVGDRALLTDPGYPCNAEFVRLLGADPRTLVLDEQRHLRPDAAQIRAAWNNRTRLMMLASPMNPTGQILDNAELLPLHRTVTGLGGSLVMDEIYQGLQYGVPKQTALALADDNLFVVNSFSKFFGMTGWRVGWVVAPQAAVDVLERLAQNLYLAAPTPSQHAALAAFSPQTRELLEQRRQVFAQRRDLLAQGVRSLGLRLLAEPDGAFYLYADIADQHDSAARLARELLDQAGVAVTPGGDFGRHHADRRLRLAYTTDQARLELGLERMWRYFSAGG